MKRLRGSATLSSLTCFAVVLATANVFAWSGIQPVNKDVAIEPVEGCTKALPEAPTTILLQGKQVPVTSNAQVMQIPNCAGCTLVDETTQIWCVMRQPGTDCSGWYPTLNNFERERPFKIYDCGAAGLRANCGGWISSGCCNNADDSEPNCMGNGAVGPCTATVSPVDPE